MSTNKYTRKHYHISPKAAGPVHTDSSYELRAVMLLDENQEVLTYEDHKSFIGKNGHKRFFDFLVTYKNGDKKLIEIKPISRINQFKEQIQDNRDYAAINGWIFEIWTEKELGFKNSKQITDWCDSYLKKTTGIDYANIRKQKICINVKKYYRKHIANKKINFICCFCNEEHEALFMTYNRNIARNGRYICEKEGGHMAGRLPKNHLKKDNPYACEGKKQCNECKGVKLFEEFSPDKSKRDSYSTRCKICRAAKYKAKYQEKKCSDSQSSKESK